MNVEELKRLAEAATPGPWNTSPGGCGIIGPDKQWLGGMNDWVCEYSEEMTQSENNAAFIAAANPAAVLELIRQRGELMEALKDAREMVSDWAGYASPYFQEKHDIDGDLKKLDDAISKAEG
jgi:hypothetical protein